jgi:hypothetical protein
MDVQIVLTILASKGYISDDVIPKILEEEDFKKKKQVRTKKTSEERRGVYDETKCEARVWCEGYDDVQCSFKKNEGKCLCTKHQKCVDREGRWWLGMIKEKRPENPEWNGIKHTWKMDENGKEYEEVKVFEKQEEKKKKRGRPKGSKNKKKKTTGESMKEELSIEEIEKLLKEKKSSHGGNQEKLHGETVVVTGQKEEEKEEENTRYIVDGVHYEINDEDILDPDDFSPIGKKDGHGGIIFEDEDAETKHKENIEKLSN